MAAPRKYKTCRQCKKLFYGRNRFFCSKKCIGLSLKGNWGNGLKEYQKIHFPPQFGDCEICSKHFKKKGTAKVRFCSRKCFSLYKRGKPSGKAGYKYTPEQIKNLSNAHLLSNKGRGANHYRWKGGITPINEKIRRSHEYKLWREAVFKRDNWTCIWCHAKGAIHADHIKPFAFFPELRFAIDNGRTLCAPCHRKTDTWGYGATKLYKPVQDG